MTRVFEIDFRASNNIIQLRFKDIRQLRVKLRW